MSMIEEDGVMLVIISDIDDSDDGDDPNTFTHTHTRAHKNPHKPLLHKHFYTRILYTKPFAHTHTHAFVPHGSFYKQMALHRGVSTQNILHAGPLIYTQSLQTKSF